MKESQLRLSIVLPCYNEARSVPLLLERYRECWEDLPAELILVDNGSSDDTQRVLASLLAEERYSFARMVRVRENRGYGDGIRSGLKVARGEFLAFSHADMQCPPADVFAAYWKLMGSSTPQRALIKGRRRGRHWRDKLVTSTMSVLATSLLLTRLTDINAQPKVFPRSLFSEIADGPDGFHFDLHVLYRARRSGLSISTIPVDFPPRLHGTSKWAYSLASRRRTISQTIAHMFRLRFGWDQ